MKVCLSAYKNKHSFRSKIARTIWGGVWVLFFRWTPRWLLGNYRRCILLMFGAKVGAGVRIQGSSMVWQPWKLSIGDGTWIDSTVKLYSVDQIDIGANVVISEGAFICTASHDISSMSFELKTKPIKIHDSAWICSRAIILPGVVVGEGAVVASGAVVVKDVPAWTVVGGNPAKVIGKRSISVL